MTKPRTALEARVQWATHTRESRDEAGRHPLAGATDYESLATRRLALAQAAAQNPVEQNGEGLVVKMVSARASAPGMSSATRPAAARERGLDRPTTPLPARRFPAGGPPAHRIEQADRTIRQARPPASMYQRRGPDRPPVLVAAYGRGVDLEYQPALGAVPAGRQRRRDVEHTDPSPSFRAVTADSTDRPAASAAVRRPGARPTIVSTRSTPSRYCHRVASASAEAPKRSSTWSTVGSPECQLGWPDRRRSRHRRPRRTAQRCPAGGGFGDRRTCSSGRRVAVDLASPLVAEALEESRDGAFGLVGATQRQFQRGAVCVSLVVWRGSDITSADVAQPNPNWP